MAMRVVVTGATGMLGRAVFRRFSGDSAYAVTGLCHARTGAGLVACDLRDAAATVALLDRVQPEIIVHTAAIRKPDEYAADAAAAHELNVAATATLAAWAAAHQAHFLYISSDYVFDGTAAPYFPSSAPHPVNAYGLSKLEGEQAALRVARAVTAILRVPILYTDEPEYLQESSVTAVLEKVLAAKPCVMDDWATRYPTLVSDVAEVLAGLVRVRAIGTFQWSGPEPLTKYDMALVDAELAGVDPTLFSRSGAPANGSEPRPKDCHLDRGAVEAFGVKASDVPYRTAIARVLARIRAQGNPHA